MRKIILYGSTHCADTQVVKETLSQAQIRFAYIDITSSMLQLKRFLKIRDFNDSHADVRKNGSIGIPALEVDDSVYLVDNVEMLNELIEKLGLSS